MIPESVSEIRVVDIVRAWTNGQTAFVLVELRRFSARDDECSALEVGVRTNQPSSVKCHPRRTA